MRCKPITEMKEKIVRSEYPNMKDLIYDDANLVNSSVQVSLGVKRVRLSECPCGSILTAISADEAARWKEDSVK